MLSKLLSSTIYIKIYPNKFELRSVENGKTLVLDSPESFTTKRLLVGQFGIADELLRKGVKQLIDSKLFAAKPAVLIQPMTMVDGGLSQVEERVLMELAASSGAKTIKVWVGHELSDSEVIERVKRVYK